MTSLRSSAFNRALFLVLGILLLLAACSPPQPRPTGVAYDYDAAKDMFRKGRFDKALDFSERSANASPPDALTERAQVLRVAILSGHVKAYKELADTYTKGSETTKNTRFKAEYQRLRHDYLQYGSRMALGLGEVAHRMTEGAKIPKEVTLEAAYPSAEGPLQVTQLARVKEGGWIEPDEQEAAAIDAARKGVDDALAEMVGGDRSKAREAMTAGPVKLNGVDFALFLAKQLLEGASLFDRKHIRDSQKLRVLANEAEETVKGALALLKESPDPAKEKAAKKIQDQIKTTLRNL